MPLPPPPPLPTLLFKIIRFCRGEFTMQLLSLYRAPTAGFPSLLKSITLGGMNIASANPPCNCYVYLHRVRLATHHPRLNVELKPAECVARVINTASQHFMGMGFQDAGRSEVILAKMKCFNLFPHRQYLFHQSTHKSDS